MKDQQEFLALLEKEAALQAKLQTRKILPSQLDDITAFIGRHTWQVLVVASLVTALALELAKIWMKSGI